MQMMRRGAPRRGGANGWDPPAGRESGDESMGDGEQEDSDEVDPESEASDAEEDRSDVLEYPCALIMQGEISCTPQCTGMHSSPITFAGTTLLPTRAPLG